MNSSAAQKHLIYTEMAKLLEAGFGIRQAISVILETRPPAGQAAMLREMDAGLAEGKSIAAAFGKSGGGITDLERSIVAAGERGGRLGQAFRHLADYFGMLARARRDAIQSLIYPIVLLHLGVFVSVVPMGMINEKSTAQMFVSGLLTLAGLYAGLFICWILVRLVLAAAPDQASVDQMLNRIPIFGKARRSMAMARFTKVYHTGVLAGLTMKETVATSLLASNSGVIRSRGRRLLEIAEEGGSLGPEFVRSAAFPAAFARSYATAEEAGGLDKDLGRWAEIFQEDAVRGAKAVSVAVPKICYGIAVAFVAWGILRFFSDYYGNMEQRIEDESAVPRHHSDLGAVALTKSAARHMYQARTDR